LPLLYNTQFYLNQVNRGRSVEVALNLLDIAFKSIQHTASNFLKTTEVKLKGNLPMITEYFDSVCVFSLSMPHSTNLS